MEHQQSVNCSVDVIQPKSNQQDVASLMAALQQALALEAKFQPKLQLPSASKANGGTESEITSSMRDGAAHVLRCLKVWFDLPSSVLLAALNLMDRFMSRIRARPKHLSVIAISSLHLAACQWAERCRNNPVLASSCENMQGNLPQVPEPQDLVMISQCKCTAGDIMRMEKIVEAKLGCLPQEEPVTTLTFLSLYHSLVESALQSSLLQQLDLAVMSCKLETICCDANYTTFPSSKLALALLMVEVDRLRVNTETASEASRVANVLVELQQLLQVGEESLHECMAMVAAILAPYDGYAGYAPSHRQRLTWKLSRRTLKQLRPTEKLVSVLPTIEENRQYGQVRQKRNRNDRRCSSTSVSSPSSSRLPSPRKIRPVAPSGSSPGALLPNQSSVPLPFPTKEDLVSFFDNFVPTPHPYQFRFLFGLDEERQPTGPCTA